MDVMEEAREIFERSASGTVSPQEAIAFALVDRDARITDIEAQLSNVRAQVAPANPAQVTDAWLVTNGPDGLSAKVVIGFDNLKREVVAAVFGDGDDTSEEAQDMRDRLDTPGDWEGDRWSISWSFEDGYLNVQRISDLSALTAAIGAGGQAAAESLWVPAKPEHKKIGWTYDFDQTERLSRAAEKATGYDATMEVIEFVMAEADRRHKSALSQPHPADERVVEALRRLERAGCAMSNILYNLKQDPTLHTDLRDRMEECQAEWDAALSAKEGRKNG